MSNEMQFAMYKTFGARYFRKKPKSIKELYREKSRFLTSNNQRLTKIE